MKIGILADIHEDEEGLAAALALLRREAVDRVVVLGDLFETGRRIGGTVALLKQAGAVGVWGNHDLGLCHEPEPAVSARFAGPVLDYMRTLRPRLELAGCLFCHGLPCWDPADPAIYYMGATPITGEGRAGSFAASACRVTFAGHFHRWLAATPEGPLAWDGGEAVALDAEKRHLVVVAAVCDGWCATYDAAAGRLVPLKIRDNTRQASWPAR